MWLGVSPCPLVHVFKSARLNLAPFIFYNVFMIRFTLQRIVAMVLVFFIGLFGIFGSALASESWVKSQASPAITRLNEAVSYKIEAPQDWLNNTKPIQRVDAHLQYQGDATVISQLCLANSYQCVPLNGAAFSTDAFNGEPSNSAFLLVHTVTRWNGAHPMLFIKSSVSVWSGR